MKIRKFVLYAVLPVLVLSVLPGCVKRELNTLQCEGELIVHAGWDPEAPAQPSGKMNFHFYHGDGTFYKTYEDVERTFRGVFPPGKYRLVVHNADAERIEYREMGRHETASVFAGEKAIYDDGIHWNVLEQPYRVFASGEVADSKVFEVRPMETLELTVPLRDLVKRVHLRVSFPQGSADVAQVSGYLKGVSCSVTLETGQCNYLRSNLVEYAAEKATDKDRFDVTIYVFDLHTRTFTGHSTVDVDIASSRYGPLSESAEIDSILAKLQQENDGVLPPDIYINLDIEYTEQGIDSVEVMPWDPGEEKEIPIEKPDSN